MFIDWERSSQTPLHLAARFNHPAVIRISVKSGASITARDIYGEIPLHKPVIGRAEAISVLLELGTDIACTNHF